jgi:hypothetical protein
VDNRSNLPMLEANSSATLSLEGGSLHNHTDASATDAVIVPLGLDGRPGEECHCQLKADCLEILPAKFSVIRHCSKVRPYTVQYRCQHDTYAWTSKVWNVHIYRTELRLVHPPVLRVSIYHDAEKPYQLLRTTPSLREWLSFKLGYFSGLLDVPERTLGQTAKAHNDIFPKAIARWQMAVRDIEVLALALTEIGNGGFNAAVRTLEASIWQGFLHDCRRWESCEEREAFARLQAEQYRARIAKRMARVACETGEHEMGESHSLES